MHCHPGMSLKYGAAWQGSRLLRNKASAPHGSRLLRNEASEPHVHVKDTCVIDVMEHVQYQQDQSGGNCQP